MSRGRYTGNGGLAMTRRQGNFGKCRGRPAGLGRPLVEDALKLPISLLKRRGALTPGYTGTVRWTGVGAAIFSVTPTCLKVTPDTPSASTYYIPLARRPCRLGGHELLMGCPACHQCRRALYWAHGRFVCRTCADLRYESQRLNRDWRRYRRMLKRLELLDAAA
jgi:hypothetical protein